MPHKAGEALAVRQSRLQVRVKAHPRSFVTLIAPAQRPRMYGNDEVRILRRVLSADTALVRVFLLFFPAARQLRFLPRPMAGP